MSAYSRMAVLVRMALCFGPEFVPPSGHLPRIVPHLFPHEKKESNVYVLTPALVCCQRSCTRLFLHLESAPNTAQ